MKKQILIGMSILIIVSTGLVLADPTFDFNLERNPIWAAIFGVEQVVELDIVDLNLCGINANIIETSNIVSVFNYTLYNFEIDNGTIIRDFYNITRQESIYKVPFFPNGTTYTNNFTFSDLGFGEINDTIVPFIEQDYYWYYLNNDTIANVTFAFIYRPIHSNNVTLNETSMIVGNNTLTITKTGWYKILYNPLSDLNLSLNNVSLLTDFIHFPLTNPSIVYLEEGDFITSKYYIKSPFGVYPNTYFGFQNGDTELEYLNNKCYRLALEYVGT